MMTKRDVHISPGNITVISPSQLSSNLWHRLGGLSWLTWNDQCFVWSNCVYISHLDSESFTFSKITLSQAHGYISTNAIKACFDSSWAGFFLYQNANFFALSFRYEDDRFSRVFHLIDTPRHNFLRTTPDGSGFDANLPINSAN